MKVNIIAAVSKNGVIGNKTTNTLPWKAEYPEDMKHFRQMTAGGTVIMGSRTYRSIGRLLPKRRNVIISRSAGSEEWQTIGAHMATNFKEALDSCKDDEKVWVIGGGVIYQEALPHTDAFYLTRIPEVVEGKPDELVYFPYLNPQDYEVVETLTLSVDTDLSCHVISRR